MHCLPALHNALHSRQFCSTDKKTEDWRNSDLLMVTRLSSDRSRIQPGLPDSDPWAFLIIWMISVFFSREEKIIKTLVEWMNK